MVASDKGLRILTSVRNNNVFRLRLGSRSWKTYLQQRSQQTVNWELGFPRLQIGSKRGDVGSKVETEVDALSDTACLLMPLYSPSPAADLSQDHRD